MNKMTGPPVSRAAEGGTGINPWLIMGQVAAAAVALGGQIVILSRRQ